VAERWFAVDALRGLAVLGILWMNIPFFSIIPQFALNPDLPEGVSPANRVMWFISYIVFEGKMRCLFSMLFGAGMVLLTGRAEARGAEAADIYYRRTIWLMIIGLLHAYFLWDGDILFWYGALGLLLYPFRRLSGYLLLVIGLLLCAISIPQAIYQEHQFNRRQELAREANERHAAGQPLSEEQTAARKSWNARQRRLRPPTQQEIDKRIKEYQDSYFEIFKRRAGQLLNTHAQGIYQGGLQDVLGVMMLGMALLKLGILNNARSLRFYIILALIGYGVGLSLSAYHAMMLAENNFLRGPLLFWFHISYNLDRLLVTLGHLALLMSIIQLGWLRWLTSGLAAVGQMALTNYLMQSAICTTLFYGYGFGCYGRLHYYELFYVVLAIWAVQLLISPLWLRFFRFGPIEWIWRSLTYLRLQPILRQK
jgi:uncharacterized protein